MTPSVPILTDLTVYSWLAFNTVLFYALTFSQGLNSLSYSFSYPTVNRKKKEKERRELLKISDLLCREQMPAPSLIRLLHPSLILNYFSLLILEYPLPPSPHTKLFQPFLLSIKEQGIGGGWADAGRCLTARQRRDLGEFRLTMSRDFCRKNFPLYKSPSSLMWAEPWLLPFCFFL